MLNWRQLNRKQKWIVSIYGSLAVLFVGYISVYGLNILNVMLYTFDSSPCIYYDLNAVNPLIVGKKASLKIGASRDSDCVDIRGYKDKTWIWSSQNPEIAKVGDDGTVTGISPGKFGVLAKNPSEQLYVSGIVYPPNWKARIQPKTLKVRVGEIATFQMIATDSQDKPLPPMFFFLTTPDYRLGQSNSKPNPDSLVTPSFEGSGGEPRSFQALRPGTIIITGKMADRIEKATLTIKN